MKNENLTLGELMYIQGEVNSKSKSVLGSYLLTFLLWPLGVNRAYLEKTKSAIFRIILTILTVINFFVIANSAIVSSPEEIAKALVSSTSLAMSFILLFSISIIMLLLELILIPRWVNDIDNKNEMVAIGKAKRARYLSEHLLKDAISEYLLEEIKSEVNIEINNHIEGILSNFENNIVNKIKKPQQVEIDTSNLNLEYVSNDCDINDSAIDNSKNYSSELIKTNNIKSDITEKNVETHIGKLNKLEMMTKNEKDFNNKIGEIELYEKELKDYIKYKDNNLIISIQDIIKYKLENTSKNKK